MIGFFMRLIGKSGRNNELKDSITNEKARIEHKKVILDAQEERAQNEINRLVALGVQVQVKARDYDKSIGDSNVS